MFWLTLISGLIGCADYSMIGIEKRIPEVLVHPLHLDFGHLESGQEQRQKYFTITNTGDENLTVTSPVLISGNDRFSIVGAPDEEFVIPGGEMLQIDVLYVPETFESNGGYIEFQTDDEDVIGPVLELVGLIEKVASVEDVMDDTIVTESEISDIEGCMRITGCRPATSALTGARGPSSPRYPALVLMYQLNQLGWLASRQEGDRVPGDPKTLYPPGVLSRKSHLRCLLKLDAFFRGGPSQSWYWAI